MSADVVTPSLIAVYGTLRAPAVRRRLGVEAVLRFRGRCRLPGRLYDLGDYPGLVAGDGTVQAELYALTDPRALARIDAFEDIVPGNPAASLYRRECWRMLAPDVEAWVYVYNRPVAGLRRVSGGDWMRLARRGGARLG